MVSNCCSCLSIFFSVYLPSFISFSPTTNTYLMFSLEAYSKLFLIFLCFHPTSDLYVIISQDLVLGISILSRCSLELRIRLLVLWSSLFLLVLHILVLNRMIILRLDRWFRHLWIRLLFCCIFRHHQDYRLIFVFYPKNSNTIPVYIDSPRARVGVKVVFSSRCSLGSVFVYFIYFWQSFLD